MAQETAESEVLSLVTSALRQPCTSAEALYRPYGP